jgi:hypothetical protein
MRRVDTAAFQIGERSACASPDRGLYVSTDSLEGRGCDDFVRYHLIVEDPSDPEHINAGMVAIKRKGCK